MLKDQFYEKKVLIVEDKIKQSNSVNIIVNSIFKFGDDLTMF